MNKKKYTKLINELSNILNDSEVKEDVYLTQMLSKYKNKLEEGSEYNLICAQLSNFISEYLLKNKFKSPKSILNLYENLSSGNNKYKGMMSISGWF